MSASKILLPFATLLCLLYPIYSLLLLPFLIKHDSKITRIYSIILLSTLFALIAATQEATGTQATDIVRYAEFYDIYKNYSLLEHLSFQPNYPLFSFINHFLSPFPFRYTAFTLIFVYYLSILFSVYLIANKYSLPFFSAIFLICFGTINFTMASELLKQLPAFALASVAIVLFDRKNILWGISFIFLALGLHYSAIVLIPIIISAPFFWLIALFSACALILSFINLNELLSILLCLKEGTSLCYSAKKYTHFLDWKITFREHISLLLISFGSALISIGKKWKSSPFYQKVVFLYCIFLIMNFSTTHNFIRFLHGSAPLISLLVPALLKSHQSSLLKGVVISIFVLFVGYNFSSLYMRLTRPTYQSSYLYKEPAKLLNHSIFYFLEQPISQRN